MQFNQLPRGLLRVAASFNPALKRDAPKAAHRLTRTLGVWGYSSTGDRMNTYIALFRGINVGGNNSLSMKELVALTKRFLLITVFLCISGQLYAYCEGGKYPNISVAEEIMESKFIIVGKVTSRRIVVDPESDPEGYEAEIFQVSIESVLHGHPPKYVMRQYLSLFNSNDSSRFPMIVGEKYLLFVSSGSDGFWINSCGNSDNFNDSREKISIIKKSRQR